MTTQENYQKAKQAGYSDEEIMEYLSKKDPSFSQKIEKAQEAGYKPQEVLSYFNSPKKEEIAGGDYIEDVAKQGAQGLGIGAIGTYGDILDLFGLQSKETLPGEQAKTGREFEVLEKMQQGQKPSFSDISELSEDDVLPRYSRLPSSQEVETLGKKTGLVSEPKTFAGRYAKRIGKLGGSTLATGGTSIKSPIAAGLAGQTIEEAGGPPWMQAAAEIIATIKTTPNQPRNITSKTPEVEEVIKNLRKSGYSEKDITLAKSALEERKILKKYSSLTPEAENAIQTGVKNSEKLLEEQVKKGLPGYAEGGLSYLEKQASNVYQTMEDLASSIPVKNTEPIKKAIQNSIDYLEKYPLLKEQKEFIEFLKDGLNKSSNANTAEFFTGFYRNLGRAGNWGNPKQKEHLLGIVKKGIKETFDQSGPEAAKFGKYFEKTNEAWKKWLNAKDLMETFEKSQTVNGVDFKKLASSLNDPDTYNLAKKVLGPEQVKNIDSINKGAQAIENLMKQIPKTDKGIQSLKLIGAIGSLFSGNKAPLATIISMEGVKRLSTQLLINPEKQNIMKKLIIAARNNSPQQAAILAQELLKDEESKKDSSQATKIKQQHPKLVK